MPSSSKEPSQPPDLPSLNHAFLEAYRANDLEGLANFNADLSRVLTEVERTHCSKDSVPNDNTLLELLLFSHNVHITSTLVPKVQLEIEELSNSFAQQLNLLPGPRPTIAPTLQVPPSQSLSPASGDNVCSSGPNIILKKWSLLHMSHLFPSKVELEALASQTLMSQSQINLWFRNARTRSGWSKLFAHPDINKDQERLKALLEEYQSVQRRGNPSDFKSFLDRNQLLQQLDKVLQWFATTKQARSAKPDAVKPWIKEVLSNALATLKDRTQMLSSLPSRKRARTKKYNPAPSSLSQSSTPIASPSSIATLESPRSSLSQPTTTGSIPAIDFSPIFGSPSSESLYSDDPSPSTSSSHLLPASPVLSSLPRTCTPAPSLIPAWEASPSNSERVRNLFIPSNLSFAHPNQSTDPDQFEDAEET